MSIGDSVEETTKKMFQEAGITNLNTVENHLLFRACLHMMPLDEAQEVLEKIKKRNEEEVIRWSNRLEEYPPQFLAVLWVDYKTECIAWLEEKFPNSLALIVFKHGDAVEEEVPSLD